MFKFDYGSIAVNPKSLLYCAVTVACHVIPASGRLVDVDIPELSESPWPGLDIFWASMGLGRRIVRELDLKLTLGMAERRMTESPPDEESWGEGQRFKSRPDPKSPSHGVWLFLVQSVTIPVGHSSDVKQRLKKKIIIISLDIQWLLERVV